MKITRVHSIVLEQVRSALWAIVPQKLDAIVAMLELHAAGVRLSDEELLAFQEDAPRASQAMGTGPVDGVAVIPIVGTIAPRSSMLSDSSGGVSAAKVSRQLRTALADPNVGSIVLDLDSPGGAVSGTVELASEIYAARGRKPIVALANDMAASGAYWIGSAATEMYATTPVAQVGSIGVITEHVDQSAYNEQEGVKVTTITAGKLKGATSPHAPLSDEGRALIQSRVDRAYEAFVSAVAKHRGTSPTNVKNGFGEGALVGAADAKGMGMIDGIATMDQAITRARQLARKQRAAVSALNDTYLLGI